MKSPTPNFSRRRFLQTSTAATFASPFLLRPSGRAAPGPAPSPNSKLHHACIGVGGMGWNDLQNFVQHARTEVVAICDVDSTHLDKAATLVPGARRYSDWRELLEKEGDRIDSVNVTVPDHMHFPIALSAIRRGKHVYCQKPMCHDVAEVRALTEAATRRGVITQLGTQMAAGTGDRTTVEWLRSGVIGPVQRVVVCANRPGAVENYRLKGPRPGTGRTPPATLNWDLWLGTAPTRPFAPEIYHPVKWRAWLDFGTGWSGDIGCHLLDAVWKGLGLTAPKSVVAEAQTSWKDSPERRADNWPQANHITWTFPGNRLTQDSDWTLEWFDGEFYPPDDIRALYSKDFSEYPTESAMVIGRDGALLNPLGRAPVLLPENKFKDIARPALRERNHYHLFADACLGGAPTESHFAQTGPMTEAILLGTIAVRRAGERLEWDAPSMTFPNAPAANALIRRRYREGWEIKGV